MRTQFCVQVERRGDVVTLALEGELDLSVIQNAEVALDAAEREDGVREVVLDLTQLSFIDSTGLRFIISADSRSRRGGYVLRLIAGNDRVRRILRLTGLDERLNIVVPD